MNEKSAEFDRLVAVQVAGTITRDEYRHLLELMGVEPQLIEDLVAREFDDVDTDTIELPEGESHQ